MSNIEYISKLIKNIKNNYIRMIVIAFVSFISSVIYARLLGPKSYGVYTYMIWLTGTLTSILGLGLSGTVTKYIPQFYFGEETGKARNFLRTILLVQILVILMVSLILALTYDKWVIILRSIEYSNLKLVIMLGVINVLPTSVMLILSSTMQALQRFDKYSKIAISAQLIGLIVNVTVIIITKRVEWILVTSIIIALYQAVLYYINSFAEFKNSKATDGSEIDKRGVAKYSWYMYINVLWQQVVFAKSEYFFLGLYSGSEQVAIYGIAFGLVNVCNMIFSPVMNVVNNYFSELVTKNNFKLIEKLSTVMTRWFSIVLLLVITSAFGLSSEVIDYIYSSKYSMVTANFLIILTGFVIVQSSSVAASLPFLMERQRFVLRVGFIIGILNITMDLILIPKFGAIGASIANTTAQVISSLVIFMYTKKITGFRYGMIKLLPCLILSVLASTTLVMINGLLTRVGCLALYYILFFAVIWKNRLFDIGEIKRYAHLMSGAK